jgi:hypothetical protein
MQAPQLKVSTKADASSESRTLHRSLLSATVVRIHCCTDAIMQACGRLCWVWKQTNSCAVSNCMVHSTKSCCQVMHHRVAGSCKCAACTMAACQNTCIELRAAYTKFRLCTTPIPICQHAWLHGGVPEGSPPDVRTVCTPSQYTSPALPQR